MSRITTRQWRLKDYLDAHRGEGYISIEQICRDLNEFYTLNRNPYVHDKCAVLSSDVRSINWCVEDGFQIIIKNERGGIKYAESKKEFEAWHKAEKDKIEKKYEYLNNLVWKEKQDGIVPIINKANNPVDLDKMKPINVFKGGI